MMIIMHIKQAKIGDRIVYAITRLISDKKTTEYKHDIYKIL